MISKSLRKVFAVAALALTLVGCESAADKARKPEAVDQTITQSITYCQTGASTEAYAQRLRDFLPDVRTADMELLKQNNIVVCLDQRLANQKNGFFDTRMEGVYYNNGGKGGVLSLWDNGKAPSFWSKDAKDWGASLIKDFAEHLRDGKIKPTDAHWYAYEGSYTTSCGDNCTTTNYYVDWVREARFDKDTIRKNADIVSMPPLRATPAAPGPGR